MGVALAYPSSLPTPSVATTVADERRLLSPSAGFFEARAVERDRRVTQTLTFPPFTAAEAATFWAWWRDTLYYGGAWWVCAWPLPSGAANGVRQFRGVPQSQRNNSMEQITAVCVVRGRGVEPPEDHGIALNWDKASSDIGSPSDSIWVRKWIIAGESATLGAPPFSYFYNFTPYTSAGGIHLMLYGDKFKSSGKRYFEITVADASGSDADHALWKAGVTQASFAAYWPYLGPGRGADGVDDPLPTPNLLAFMPTDTSPMTLCVAVDLDAGNIWFGSSGVYNSIGDPTPDPATGVQPAFSSIVGPVTPFVRYFAVSMQATVTLATVDADFSFAPPAGFSAFGDP